MDIVNIGGLRSNRQVFQPILWASAKNFSFNSIKRTSPESVKRQSRKKSKQKTRTTKKRKNENQRDKSKGEKGKIKNEPPTFVMVRPDRTIQKGLQPFDNPLLFSHITQKDHNFILPSPSLAAELARRVFSS
jgi:hypothetical protein